MSAYRYSASDALIDKDVGLRAVHWFGCLGLQRPAPDLSDVLAYHPDGKAWLLVLWEPLATKAPSPARCQPYCCYINTVIFYHRPYVAGPAHPYRTKTGYGWSSGGFETFDQIEGRLHWNDIVDFRGAEFVIGGGSVRWHRQRWWMRREAKRREACA